jgi:hypothetical protein
MSVHPCPMPRCVDPRDPAKNAPLVTTPLCEPHRSRLNFQLLDVPSTYVRLDLALGSHGKASDVRVSRGKPEPPTPLNVGVRALQEDLVRLLLTAEDELRLALDLPSFVAGEVREGVALTAASEFLAVRLDRLLAEPTGILLAVDLDQLLGTIRRALGLAKLVHRLPAPCPSCELLTLRRDDGASFVRCVNDACNRSFSEDDYARLVLILASDRRSS